MDNNINNVSGRMATSNSDPAPIQYNMGTGVLGSYDNLKLRTKCKDSWKSPPCDPPLKSNKMFLPQGTPLPLKNEMIYSELPKDSMFMFARNPSSLECSSQYTTDRGPVCTTYEQRKYVGEQRGLNKTYGNYSF